MVDEDGDEIRVDLRCGNAITSAGHHVLPFIGLAYNNNGVGLKMMTHHDNCPLTLLRVGGFECERPGVRIVGRAVGQAQLDGLPEGEATWAAHYDGTQERLALVRVQWRQHARVLAHLEVDLLLVQLEGQRVGGDHDGNARFGRTQRPALLGEHALCDGHHVVITVHRHGRHATGRLVLVDVLLRLSAACFNKLINDF